MSSITSTSNFSIKEPISLESVLAHTDISSDWNNQAAVAIVAARAAGKTLLAMRSNNEVVEFKKNDGELVTSADFASNKIVCEALNAAFPDYGILSEEAFKNSEKNLKDLSTSVRESMNKWNHSEFTWVIDPLDGTSAYKRSEKSDYGVLIALNHNGQTVLGVSYFPVRDYLYFAVKDHGAYKWDEKGITRLRVDDEIQMGKPPYGLSKEIHDFFGKLFSMDREATGFLPKDKSEPYDCCGWKLCQIAEGKDALFATAAVGIWDWCSGTLIAKEAGGFVSDCKGEVLDYVHSEDGRMRKGQIAAANQRIYTHMLSISKELVDGWKLK